jgi:uncharacterized repeat protein (TIGR01451 family)
MLRPIEETETMNKPNDRQYADQGAACCAPTETEKSQPHERRDTMKHPRKFLMSILAATLLLPAIALAAPQVELAIQAEKEVTVTEDGQTVVKRVSAAEAAPGETVIFTISYANTGDEAATNVVINNPLSEGTTYIPGSATETGEVTFSIDGGETFKRPSLLTYETTNPDGSREKRTASPEQYTHVRWQLPEIPARGKGEVSFRVKVQ